ncbi:hypothetical protein PR202_gb24232 [Eleusine coracana subsp. coracana]|uniref:Uncharacterized protein n=1 Tax=Eleusine coracana subsp. coracana TaxID=191504 RepID=A0AAV5FL47_ELECO|nr:hypothetical protein PR202_gb24232 [Eleusine coracana subsp. coracana]
MTWRRRGTSLRSLDGSEKDGTIPPTAETALRAMRPRCQAMARLWRPEEKMARAAVGAGELADPQLMRDVRGRRGKPSAAAARRAAMDDGQGRDGSQLRMSCSGDEMQQKGGDIG